LGIYLPEFLSDHLKNWMLNSSKNRYQKYLPV
jgi:hypothetical protein